MLKIFSLKSSKTIILTTAAIIAAAVLTILAVKTPNAGQQETRDKRQETSAERQTMNAERRTLNAETPHSTPSRFANSNESLEKIGQAAPLPAAFKPVPLSEIQEAISEFAEKSGLDSFGALVPTVNTQKTKNAWQGAGAEETMPFLFPEPYVRYLISLRDFMQERGALGQNEFTAFTTNDEVLNFLPRLLDFAAGEEWITKTQAENYKQNIEPNFNAIKVEYLQFRSSQVAKKTASVYAAPVENESSRRITEIFIKYFWNWMRDIAVFAKIPVAEAFVPLCYKDAMPLNLVPGINLWAFCCNCGIKFTPKPVFVPVCGPTVGPLGGKSPKSPLCDLPLGCLNAVCIKFPNAIWDPTTGICGCG